MTYSFNPLRAMVVTHTHAKDQDQMSVSSKDKVKMDEKTVRQTEAIALPPMRRCDNHYVRTGFVQTLESPGIKMLRFPDLESPVKRHRSWKTLEKSWNCKILVLEILISGTSIAN